MLSHLSEHPELALFIKELTVRPNHVSWGRPDRKGDETEIVNLLEKIMLAGSLSNLERFAWDGKEIPRDTLWSTLKQKCVPFLA